ncbi:MAG: DUF4007 family protein [Burkholderiales bacterium]|nr:DUF4007 family protein [Burkholderiales bacterium]
MTDVKVAERYSGHESFVCRYGWLPKVYRAISSDPGLLRDEERAIQVLGIGRNMVKSLSFWSEAAGVLRVADEGGHEPGEVGRLLFGGDAPWDTYLESLESLWLIHWYLCVKGGAAAWREVFADGKLIRFEKRQLVEALARRSEGAARPLAQTTLEQHASIFIQSYYQEERGIDDTSWSPLQDLRLLRVSKSDDGRAVFDTSARAPVGLSCRVFGIAVVEFVTSMPSGKSADLQLLLHGVGSPGAVFRLDESQLRLFVDLLCETWPDAIRFVDTADTQSIVVDASKLNAQYMLQTKEAAHV